MITLRDYQQQAVDAVINDLATYKKVVAVLATGSGKSLINASIALRAIKKGFNVLCLCHQAEILEQNEKAILSLNPSAPVGIYCAGLDRKELYNQITLASRDSFKNIKDFMDYDLIIVDEAHKVSPDDKSSYFKVIETIKPKYIIGLTATPWRMNKAIWSDVGYFDKISCNIGIEELTKKDYLSPYVFPQNKNTIIKANDLKKTGGDFNKAQLETISNKENITKEVIKDWQEKSQDRVLSLFFCTSIKHAEAVYKELVDININTGYLDGKTNKADRETFFKKALNKDFKAIVNVGTLTTGVNIPHIDCIVMLRATASPSLYVQMFGRGLRLADNKKDCLFLDYTDNFLRFHSIEKPNFLMITENIKKKKIAAQGESVEIKTCPSCAVELNARVTFCFSCGHLFVKHTKQAFLNNDIKEAREKTIEKTNTKKGEECFILKIKDTNNKTYRMWLLIKRAGFLGKKARAILAKYQEITCFTIQKSDNGFITIKDVYYE